MLLWIWIPAPVDVPWGGEKIQRYPRRSMAMHGLSWASPVLRRTTIVGRGTVAVACGAAGELLGAAREAGCDAMLLGETRFHTFLEAEAADMCLLLPGHFASERFGLECLAETIGEKFPELEVWPSREEHDPIGWL